MTYLTKSIPRSTRELIDNFAQDRVSTIVTNAITNYIDRFLNTQGVLRSMTEAIGTNTLQFITNKKDVLDTNNPSNIKTQLAVSSENLTEKIPAIIINDKSCAWEPAGLGQKDEEYGEGKDLVNSFAAIFNLDVEIAIVTHDEVSTKDLASLIAIMFGPLQNLAGGAYIKSDDPKSPWVIHLPLIFPNPDIQSVDIPGDQVSKYWVGRFTIPKVRYENKFLIKFGQEVVTSTIAVVDQPTIDIPPEFLYTGDIKIGQSVTLPIKYMQPSDDFVINNLTPFSVEWEVQNKTNAVVFGNKPGKFELIVKDISGKVRGKKEYNVIL